MRADRPVCQPLADITSTKPKIHRMAVIGAAFAKQPKGGAAPAPINQMLIASHAPGDAQKVMDVVKSALAGCTSFTGDRRHRAATTPFTISKGPAVAVGDASVGLSDDRHRPTGRPAPPW